MNVHEDSNGLLLNLERDLNDSAPLFRFEFLSVELALSLIEIENSSMLA